MSTSTGGAGTDVAALNMFSDISKLEAPSFSTLEKKPPAQVLALNWDHQVNLVGKKVPNPMFHCCDLCRKPILIYGRMIPCKHVFCFSCAKQDEKSCPRCQDKVKKVEQCDLGTIFLCTQDGTRYGNNGCRRTYLSSRDLQAHIKHRHSNKEDSDRGGDRREISNTEAIRNAVNSLSKASLEAAVAAAKAVSSAGGGYGNVAASLPQTINSAKVYVTSTSTLPYSGISSTPGGYAGPGAPHPPQTSTAFPAAPSTYRPTNIPGGVPAPAGGGGASHSQISVLNTRQSNLITIPTHTEGGGSEGSTGYAGGGYPGYSPAPAYPPGYPAVPVTISTPANYTQGSSYAQPPPGSGATAYQYPANQYQPNTGGVVGYPGPQGQAPPGQAGVPAPSPYPTHFNRPPPPGLGMRQPMPGGVRPPPANGGMRPNYQRR